MMRKPSPRKYYAALTYFFATLLREPPFLSTSDGNGISGDAFGRGIAHGM